MSQRNNPASTSQASRRRANERVSVHTFTQKSGLRVALVGWLRNEMNESPDSRVTQLLLNWSAGDQRALGELMPLVYTELRRLADRQLRAERANHTLQRTALVHEAYLRLINQRNVSWQGRAQFIGLAAQLMRRILIDHARARRRAKRGGGVAPVSLDQTGVILGSGDEEGGARIEALEFAEDPTVDLSAIDSALSRLEELDPKQGRIVELRFFGGLSIEETAEVVGVSPATVKREWALARAWLRRELTSEASP
jgi:RNA polymerase sigma factor (TIGR02999 family)